jgi:hypothetical protein
MKWKSVELTWVMFPEEGGAVALMLAYSSLAPVALIVAMLTLIVTKRQVSSSHHIQFITFVVTS